MNIWDEYKKIRATASPLLQRIDKVLKTQGINSIETFLIFEIICQGTTSLSAIGRELGMNTGSITTVIKKLADKGYITNTPDPNDNSDRLLKRKLLNPTDKGKEIYTQLMQQFETE